MRKIRSLFAAFSLVPLLGACVSAGSGPIIVPNSSAPRPAPNVTTKIPERATPVNPSPGIMRAAGLEGVIGANASQLLRRFGNPQLDVREGDARKLQFAGEPCVLDIFLYPLRSGADPVATHVEARRASDGRDVDRAACAKALGGR